MFMWLILDANAVPMRRSSPFMARHYRS